MYYANFLKSGLELVKEGSMPFFFEFYELQAFCGCVYYVRFNEMAFRHAGHHCWTKVSDNKHVL